MSDRLPEIEGNQESLETDRTMSLLTEAVMSIVKTGMATGNNVTGASGSPLKDWTGDLLNFPVLLQVNSLRPGLPARRCSLLSLRDQVSLLCVPLSLPSVVLLPERPGPGSSGICVPGREARVEVRVIRGPGQHREEAEGDVADPRITIKDSRHETSIMRV